MTEQTPQAQHERLNQQAVAFIEANGTTLERWQARRLLGIVEPMPGDWADRQTAEGGWRNRDSDATAPYHMGTTCLELLHLVGSGLQETAACQRTVDFLWAIQQEEGRWTENPAHLLSGEDVADYNQPGDVNVDLWVTANTLASLAALGFAHDPRVTRAVEWVSSYEAAEIDCLFPRFHHTLFAMAAVQWMRGEQEAAERYLQRMLTHFQTFKNEPWYDIMDIGWALKLLAVAQIPSRHATVTAFLQELVARRQADGTWRSIYGVHEQFTLEALLLLEHYSFDM